VVTTRYEQNLLYVIRINIVFRTSNVNDVRQFEYAVVMRRLNTGLSGGGGGGGPLKGGVWCWWGGGNICGGG